MDCRVCDQPLKQRLTLDEREARYVPAVEMQEVEGAIDAPHFALALGRLGMGETRQPGLIDVADFALEIGGLRVKPGSSQ